MVAQIMFLPVAVIVMIVRAWRRMPTRPLPPNDGARRLLRIAVVMLWVNAAFWAFMGVGEVLGGDISGVGHLLPAVLGGILAWLVGRRPGEGAVVLVGLGMITTAWYLWPKAGGWQFDMVPIVLLAMPFLVPGLLLWAAFENREAS